jgi:hypothetical protein
VYLDFHLRELYENFGQQPSLNQAYFRTAYQPSAYICFARPLAARYCALGAANEEARRPGQEEVGDGEKGEEAKEEQKEEKMSRKISPPLLDIPLLRQLFIVLDLILWNKPLVKAIIAKFPPPPPHADILFGRRDLTRKYQATEPTSSSPPYPDDPPAPFPCPPTTAPTS